MQQIAQQHRGRLPVPVSIASVVSQQHRYNCSTATGKRTPPSIGSFFSKRRKPSASEPTSASSTASTPLGIPPHAAHKVCSPSDAVSLISAGDTICVSGFVGQGSPDLILKALADRYERECRESIKGGVAENGQLRDLTVLFGGGPGDWQSKGLNYLAKIPSIGGASCEDGNDPASSPNQACGPMVKRAIGGHFGQVPLLGELATSNQIEAWTLPMGSISRMIRAQATHSPGHITTVGLGTYVDPTSGVGCGGAANQLALDSPLQKELVTKLTIGKSDYLMYKALPIQVAVIRATTADSTGNLSFEHESLLCDQRNIAMAARNSGGVVLAQVKRLCAVGSLPSRSVGVPGAMVDCVCVVPEDGHDEYHPMSYTTRNDPVLYGEIKSPSDETPKMPLNERKIIARRASFALKSGKTINLGIGLPEGVASVAAEEGQLPFVTLTTEPGVFGGLPASGHEFGPAYNADSIIEMNQMFDAYDGGLLDMSFLGAAQISRVGDVNVSRMSASKLIGPGGFIDISQSTRNICFTSTFTAKGLDIEFDGDDGSIKILEDGKIKKFVNDVYERTFSGDEAVRRGQKVFYVTERAVFRRTAAYDCLELIEIAPGVDLERDILAQMEFAPAISRDLKEMDRRIFRFQKMGIELFGSLKDRIKYRSTDNSIFIDLSGISLAREEEIEWFANALDQVLTPMTKKNGPADVIVTYDGFDLRSGLEEAYSATLERVEEKHYKSVKRYSGKAFRRAKLKQMANIESWDARAAFVLMDEDGSGDLSPEEFRRGVRKQFGIKLKQAELDELCHGKITMHNFSDVVYNCLRTCT